MTKKALKNENVAPVVIAGPTNLRIVHPTQPEMFAEVVAASRHAATGKKVLTLHLRYPRIIHGEMMTHRVFNRNARSSRAVPIKTMLREIRDTPFIPWHWSKAQKGMQGALGWEKEVTLLGAARRDGDDKPVSNVEAWLRGRDMACDLAESFGEAEYHKQVANRLVEPFMWMDLLVTATQWKNFLHLRDHPDAEPHIRDLAVIVGKAIEQAEYKTLKAGEWHLPYITDEDRAAVIEEETRLGIHHNTLLLRISAARCARISYTPFNGEAKIEAELSRYEMLVGNDAIHASPLEHQCTPDHVSNIGLTVTYMNPALHGPLKGFVQHRKTVPNEAIHD